jgi:hypothetical protein
MKKTTSFKKLIKENRKLLLSKGFKASTLTMWGNGERHPLKKIALKLAKILNIDVQEIPYVERYVRNI